MTSDAKIDLPRQQKLVNTAATQKRLALIVQGQVQGVGFRPFIWRLANAENLAGFVANTSAGVRIEIQGEAKAIAQFVRRLQAELPPLAKIASLDQTEIPLQGSEHNFVIKASEGHAGQNVLVSPDISICQDCLNDIRNSQNPRFGYAFTNCTNCGPRFSITRSIPYDRAATTMACFELCKACLAEYSDPANRRFHAQPIACPQCGPKLWLVNREMIKSGQTKATATNCANALAKAGEAILTGQILALRGLGGFQLVCDASNADAVQMLRMRKNRPHKALAVMARNLDAAKSICEIDVHAEKLLESPQKPIVLCPIKAPSPLSSDIAPDSLNVGVMLPYTPLHALLMDWLADHAEKEPILIMTSANPQGEPICLGNREAINRLYDLADSWLLHDRDILCRVDDSVVLPMGEIPVFLRRARGYVPEPVKLGQDGPCILGVGAELKATFCLSRGDNAFMGQHIGDLNTPANLEFYEHSLKHLQNLLEVRPEAIVHDLHPDFMSSHYARNLAELWQVPAMPLQHHAAHAAACLAENGHYDTALALCLDGSGLGTDGTIWGGELLKISLQDANWSRVGSLSAFPLPGGELAIREPCRIATALAWQAGIAPASLSKPEATIIEMLQKNLNCPKTSSCGRLFDAIASLLGLCQKITYEGQAAMRLEKAALTWLANNSLNKLPEVCNIPIIMETVPTLDATRLFYAISELREQKLDNGHIAAVFHYILARELARLAQQIAKQRRIKHIALTGGVMQNILLQKYLSGFLREYSLIPLVHKQTPPGDGGVSLGQTVFGRQLVLTGNLPHCN